MATSPAEQVVIRHAVERGHLSSQVVQQVLRRRQDLLAQGRRVELLALLGSSGLLDPARLEELAAVYRRALLTQSGGSGLAASGSGSGPVARPAPAAGPPSYGPHVDRGAATIAGGPAARTPAPAPVPAPAASSPSNEATRTIDVDPSASGQASRPPGSESGSPAPERVGPYRIVRELARGGMGVVYEARHADLGRPVALKLVLDHADAEERERFKLEAKAAARLQHPGIVAIYDVGEDAEGRRFLAMELVEGESLSARIKRRGPLPARDAAKLTQQLAKAIHYAHTREILHRDLKPGNVLIDREGTPRLTDFGLAKDLRRDERLTATGDVMGTPAYMPPEQASGQLHRIDRRTDLYGIGATLYHMLTGQAPFTGTALQILSAVLAGEAPARPTSVRPGVDRDLETIVLKCLAAEPDDRYASAQDLAEDLTRFLHHFPVQARRPRVTDRLRLLGRRRRGLAAGLALAGALVLAAVPVGLALRPAPGAAGDEPADAQGPGGAAGDDPVAESDDPDPPGEAADPASAARATLLAAELDPALDERERLAELRPLAGPEAVGAIASYLDATSERLRQVEKELLARPGAVAAAFEAEAAGPLDPPPDEARARLEEARAARAGGSVATFVANVATEQRARLGAGKLAAAGLASRALADLAARTELSDATRARAAAALSRYLAAEADRDRAERAFAAFTQFVDAEVADAAAAWKERRFRAARPSARPTPSTLPAETAERRAMRDRLLAEAEVHLDARELELAADKARRALEIDADFVLAHDLRAQTLQRLGDHQGALVHLDWLVTNHPAAQNLANRGISHIRLAAFREAEADFDRALELRPDYPHALQGRAMTRSVLGNYAGARADIARARELAPSALRLVHTEAEVALAHGDFELAAAALREAFEFGNHSTAHLFAAELTFRAEGRPVEARERIDRVIDESGHLPNALALRGWLKAAAGDDTAVADLDAAVRANPCSVRFLLMRARGLAALERRAAARADCDSILGRAPGNVGARLLRARLLSDGAPAQARRELEELLARTGEAHPLAAEARRRLHELP